MAHNIHIGGRLPTARLAQLAPDGDLRIRPTTEIFAGKRAVIVGVPGAFTPVCTRVHLPRFVELAPTMLNSGLDMIVCVAPNDPWCLAAWAAQIDPEGRIRFFSDGNLEFGRAAGLTERGSAYFFGERLRRFSLIVSNGLIEKLNVETSSLEVGRSSADACMI